MLLLPRTAAGADARRRSSAGSQPRGDRLVDRLVRTPGPGLVVGRRARGARRRSAPVPRPRRLARPRVQGPRPARRGDRRAGHVARRRWTACSARMSRELSGAPGCRHRRRPRRSRRHAATRPSTRTRASSGSRIKSSADYDDTRRHRSRRSRTATPACRARCRPTRGRGSTTCSATPDGMQGKDLTVRVFGENLGTLERQARELRRRARQDRRRHRAARRDAAAGSRRSRSRSTSTRPRRSGSSPVTCAAPRPRCSRASASGSCSRSRRSSTWWCGARRRTARQHRQRQRRADRPRPTAAGRSALGDVADVRMVSSPTVIKRKDVSEAIDIGLDVDGRSIGAVADDVQARAPHAVVPARVPRRAAERRTPSGSPNQLLFLGLCVAAALGIFLVLQAALRSWLLASLALVRAPGRARRRCGRRPHQRQPGHRSGRSWASSRCSPWPRARASRSLNRCQELKHDGGRRDEPGDRPSRAARAARAVRR